MSSTDPAFGTLPPGEEPTPTVPLSAARPADAHPTEPSAEGATRSSADPTPANVRPLGTPLPPQFGRYRIVKQLGRGGMGTVYLAQDTQLGDRPVALKVPLFHPDEQSDFSERFHREAKAAAKLHHPNICAVYDVGVIDGILFLAMAYIEGQSLSQRLKTGPPLPPADAIRLVQTLALALDEAHQHGVVHRDLKPGNVILNQRGQPVIMDFGLAWVDQGDASRLTQTGQILGTPAYMPPEQVSGDTRAMGRRSDIYSLGVILYELLTGKVPFSGPSGMVLAKVLTEPPPPPSSIKPDLDKHLEAVCLKAMAKRPDDRYATMAEFAAALDGCCLEDSRVSAHGTTLLQPPPPAPRRRPRRILAATLLLFLLAGLAGLGWYYQPQLLEMLARFGKAASSPAARPPAVALKPLVEASPKARPTTAIEPVRPKPELVPEPIILRPPPGLMHTLKPATEIVHALAFSPDGRQLLSGSGGRTKLGAVQLWDVETGKELARLDRAPANWVPLQGVQKVGFSAGGTRAWSISDDTTIYLWNLQAKEAPQRLVDGGGRIRADAAMLPDGKFLIYSELDDAGANRKSTLWLAPLYAPDRPAGMLKGTVWPVLSVAISPDGRRAVSGGVLGEVIAWDLVDRKQLRMFEGSRETVRTVAYAADGQRILAGCGLGTVHVWDADTGKLLTTQSVPPKPPAGVQRGRASFAFSADGRRAIIGRSPPPAEIGDHIVWIWDLDKEHLIHRFVCDKDIASVAITPNGRFAAAGLEDRTIQVWRLED